DRHQHAADRLPGLPAAEAVAAWAEAAESLDPQQKRAGRPSAREAAARVQRRSRDKQLQGQAVADRPRADRAARAPPPQRDAPDDRGGPRALHGRERADRDRDAVADRRRRAAARAQRPPSPARAGDRDPQRRRHGAPHDRPAAEADYFASITLTPKTI